MQERELNRATIGVMNRTDIRGRATAHEMNRGLRTRKEKSFWRIASLTFLGSLMVAGFFVVVAPMPAHADNDKDKHEDNDKGIRAEIAALQAQVSALQTANTAQQNEINSLQTSNTNLQKEVNNLQTSNTNLQNQVNSLQTSNTIQQKQLATVQSNHALLLGPFVNVDPNPEIGVVGPNITFTGANIHIVSGSGSTDDNGNPTGLGNLIIGYDEAFSGLLNPGDRGGSHNLVIGMYNKFTNTAFGGLVAGEQNTISNEAASVSGGISNTASGVGASVSGGILNTANGYQASVSGGQANTASGPSASISGGLRNTATYNTNFASLLGGINNTASGYQGSVVLGGSGNTAGGNETVVIGGQNVTDNNDNSIAPKPPFP
jgi:FtsZ-binding cell division protein ZapB